MRRGTREVLNGVLWMLRTGAPWHSLPEHYPPYQTRHRRFQGWVCDGTLGQLLATFAEDLKERGGLNLSERFIGGSLLPLEMGAARGKDQAGQGYEAHGGGRSLWSSCLCTRSRRFIPRGHPCLSNARCHLRRG